ncbi:3-hydroxyacyl-ACP dehydratase [Polaromonas sp.]|uniref:3-hydroxyacyl-ACP dehydratase n=1 Tax=Polaromonas sp. TaxID=1869339 RepID=UPI003C85E0AA
MQSEETTLRFATGHPAFAGHFPGRPMVPGVLLLDAALHAAAQARTAADAANGQNPGPAPRCLVNSAKFLSPVLPDEILSISCTATAAGHTRFDIACEGRPVATGTFVFESSP